MQKHCLRSVVATDMDEFTEQMQLDALDARLSDLTASLELKNIGIQDPTFKVRSQPVTRDA